MPPGGDTRQFWERRAAALAWRINFAAWLERAAPICFLVATVFAVGLYALRRIDQPLDLAWLALAAALAANALVVAWQVRKNFFRPAEARVLIESHLRLDTSLSAATLGLVRWPAAPAPMPAVLRWQLRTPAAWLSAALALVLLARFAPAPRDVAAVHGVGPPPSLLQTEEMLAALKDMKIAAPEAINQLEERARELARQPAEDQFKHSALEAADALRDQTAGAAASLGRSLESAADALRSAESTPDMKGPAGQLAAALQGMAGGALPANKDLLSHLPGSAADLSKLTPEQRAELAKQLAKAGGQARGVAGAAGAGAKVAGPGQGNGSGQGQGQGTGNGGPGGGGGPAPLSFNNDGSDAGDGKDEGIKSVDPLKNFSLGDKLGTTKGAHDVDPNAQSGLMSAGAVAAPAQGGETVWVNRLTPAERAALKKHFK